MTKSRDTEHLPRVVVFSLGGTIAMSPGNKPGIVAGLEATELVAALPELAQVARLQVETFRQVASAELCFADIAELAERIRVARADGAQGVVVTQGTDTLEEVAFQLDLLLPVGAPIVMTGALRGAREPGADGPSNLLNAIRVAASPIAANLGVLVVMNDEIHAARFVRKIHTHRPSAFASPSVGPLGWLLEGRVRIVVRPASSLPTIAWRQVPPFVPTIAIGFSADRRAIEPFQRQPIAGAVVSALGSGHVASSCVQALEKLASRVPVVLCSRVGSGECHRSTYGYAGGEIDLLGRGLLSGGFLDPEKARIMLSLLLADGADRRRIEEVFAGCGLS